MSLLQEIFKWSESLPDWQSDTVRRLFENGILSDNDLDDLTALAKASFGIPDPAGRAAKPLRQAQVPTAAVPGDTVKLLAIKNLVNVNAIAAGQSLCFSRDGLTAIYGDTGAGKSSYSRVLKRACRARDQEPVLPNVKLQEEAQEIPQAV